MRVQYTQPPNGSLNGTLSISTRVRLTPLGPMPRSDTPCVVGCDVRLLVAAEEAERGQLPQHVVGDDRRRLPDVRAIENA